MMSVGWFVKSGARKATWKLRPRCDDRV